MRKIFVSDITLSNISEVSFKEKLNIAAALEKAGVDAIELKITETDKENAVVNRTVAASLKDTAVAVSVDSVEKINFVADSLKDIKNLVIVVSLPVSTVQMEYMYHLKSPKMLEKIAELCKAAAEKTAKVEFEALDASRAEKGFVLECAKTALENGATAVSLCDDAGIYLPDDMAAAVKEIKENLEINVFVKPSDKLNMATATALKAVASGADGVKTSALGVQTVKTDVFADIMRTKGDDLSVKTSLDVTAIHNIISGLNRGDTVGLKPQNLASPSVKDTSSLADVIKVIKSLGYELSDSDNGKVYEEFKRVSAKKGEVSTRELEAIIASAAMQVPSTYHLISYVVNSGNILTATANITLEKNGEKLSGVSVGDGPVDAAFLAIEQIIGHHYELDDFQISAITKGREALGSSIIKLRVGGKLYSGNGVSTDIIGACIRAYINALNKIVYEEN